MKRLKYFSLTISLLIAGLVQQSCTGDFEEMNRDWENPTIASIPTVMNSVLSTFPLEWMEMQAIHNGYYYVCTQQLANAGPRYVINQGEDELWKNYYGTLRTIRALEEDIANNKTGLKVDNIAAMLKVCLAYKSIRTSDYFGDIPFKMAGYANRKTPEYLRPVYDKHQDIFKASLTMLKEAADAFIDGSSDQIECVGDAYNIFWKAGFVSSKDYSMWRKFANSLRLRYALQIADVDAATAQAHISEILGNPSKYPLLDSDSRDETAGLWPKRLSLIFESRPWSFSAENVSCMGSVMWKAMTDLPVPQVGANPSTTDGVTDPKFFDPRGYLFFETNRNNRWVPQKQFDAPFVQSRGAYFTSAYPAGRDHAQNEKEWSNKYEAYYSSVNFYLTRDENSYPELIITEAETHFLKAEAYARGIGVTKNLVKARESYEAGIRASMETWFSFYELINASTYKWVLFPPHVPTADEVTAYINHAGVLFSADEATALKQIYKQLWIDSFRQPWVSFNLYRRVGPDKLPGESGMPSEFVNFYRVPYPSSEITYNNANYEAALAGRPNLPQSQKLFWHK